ncbi:hypothetical protein HHK36_001161 [Tetracentron sinense]|uniref:DUF7733 domain-containing protein n=1 Tax=Tetracentron sinense TaxID=13715 RepID=A0A834ZX51_TETSI|nr:hypothetical protein HHK36_001161 [Tetracentron sinense]
MSGGIGPTYGDISLPKEEEKQEHLTSLPKNQSTNTRRGFLNLTNLNCLAIIIVLSASGMVSIEDFGFVLFSLLYIFIISKVAFPPLGPSMEPPIFGKNNKLLGIYVSIGGLIGLFLPIGYILQGIFEGDKEGIKAAAPHLFLLCSQVFMEGLTFSNQFSVPIRVFVPVFYNSRRIFTIVEWLRSEIGKEFGGSTSTRRLYFGRGLAIANMMFWCFNLFGFLLPVYLPRAFKRYYGHKLFCWGFEEISDDEGSEEEEDTRMTETDLENITS